MPVPYAAEELLAELLRASLCPVVAADREGHILEYSLAAEKLLGYSAADARRDLIVQDLFADIGDLQELLSALDGLSGDKPYKRRIRLRARDGGTLPARISVRPLGDRAWVAVVQDTRESADLEARLHRATDQLIASEKRSTTMEVAGAAAHNLNQPLTSIMGSVELLASRRDLPPDVRRRINQVYDQLERMAHAVQELSQIRRYRTTTYVGDTQILDLSGED